MKYTFVYRKSQDGTPTLIVYNETDASIFGGISPKVINVITGKRATEVYNYLIGKSEIAEEEEGD